MILKESGGNFKPCPEGVHNAVLVDIIELPNVQSQWGTKDMIRLVWETDCAMESGKPFLAFNRYTPSLNSKATLRKHLKSWRGKDFTADELAGFDIEKIIGSPCQLVIEHNESNDGRMYANITAIIKAKDNNKLKPTGDYVRMKDRPAKDGETPKAKKEELEKDDIPFS